MKRLVAIVLVIQMCAGIIHAMNSNVDEENMPYYSVIDGLNEAFRVNDPVSSERYAKIAAKQALSEESLRQLSENPSAHWIINLAPQIKQLVLQYIPASNRWRKKSSLKYKDSVDHVAFASRGHHAIVASGRTIEIIDGDTGTKLWNFQSKDWAPSKRRIWSVALSADNKKIIIADRDLRTTSAKQILVFDVDTGNKLLGYDGDICAVRFANNDTKLVMVGANAQVLTVDIATKRRLNRVTYDSKDAIDVIAPNGSSMIIREGGDQSGGGKETLVKVTNGISSGVIHPIGITTYMVRILPVFSDNSSKAAAVYVSGQDRGGDIRLKIIDLTYNVVYSLPYGNDIIRVMKFSPSGSLLAVGYDHAISSFSRSSKDLDIVDTKNGTINKKTLLQFGSAESVSFSSDETLMAVAGGDSKTLVIMEAVALKTLDLDQALLLKMLQWSSTKNKLVKKNEWINKVIASFTDQVDRAEIQTLISETENK